MTARTMFKAGGKKLLQKTTAASKSKIVAADNKRCRTDVFIVQTPPNLRLRCAKAASASSKSFSVKSGHNTSSGINSAYADCHNRKFDSRSSPLGRRIRSGSGWPAV